MPGIDDRRKDTAAADAAPIDWAALGALDVLDALASDRQGLTAAEAERRLAEHGPNRLAAVRQRGALQRFLAQLDNLLIYVLLAAAALALLLGHGIDAAVIVAVVLVNTVIGFVQEGKAEDALAAIRSMIDPKAAVVRDGRRQGIKADQIVPGDLVRIEAGDRVPADLRLLHAKSLKLDEAALTGESVAVDKQVDPVAAGSALGDRASMVFSGTFVAAGQGTGIAVATGAGTELGRISSMLQQVAALKTPLVRQMDQFARQVTFAVIGVAALVFLFALLRATLGFAEAFMAVVGLFVAAIPEGLPAIMTITLAIGVQRMASRKAIIRRLPAVETLGAVSVICSDKTGTLTKNEMTVRSVATAAGLIEVSGTGYAPEGRLERGGEPVSLSTAPVLRAMIDSAILCNDAEIVQRENGWQAIGDPMEAALVAFAMKAGVDPAAIRRCRRRRDEIPFDSAHKFMATLHWRADGETGEGGAVHEAHAIFVKGAPERLIDMAADVLTADGPQPIDRDLWHGRVADLAAKGERVLGFAMKIVDGNHTGLEVAHLDGGVVLLGLVGFIDPPRQEAIAAVAACKSAGIRVVMITGDHALTAKEIARQLGLAEEPRVLTGGELEEMDDIALRRATLATQVFARTTPEHKLRLVGALQDEGLTVAMTGDGVNDAPALKRADVGVAMGRKGTEAAKEAAEMVLVDDNFASIVAAVREGRTVYDNIVKVIAWTLPTNGGEAFIIIAALLLGLDLPLSPVQILWVNMITAVALGLALAFEPTEPQAMRRPPRPGGQPILSGVLIWQIAFVSLLFVIGAFGIFGWAISRGLSLEVARTMVVNTIVVMEIFYLFNVRYVHGTSLTIQGLFGTPAVLAGIGAVVLLQSAFTYAPFMAIPFGTAPMAVTDGLVIIAVGAVLFAIVEIEKRLRRALMHRR